MKVSIEYSEGVHFIANVRQFNSIHIDEPESFNGTELGPSPVEYVLIGIGGCLGSTLSYCLKKKGLEINKLEIIIDGKIRHEEPYNRLRITSVDAELHLNMKDNGNTGEIDSCVESFLKYCIVSNSISQGIPIDVKVLKKDA
ncbi:MAG: OsmC family protein [Promethearchaeota archaeon]